MVAVTLYDVLGVAPTATSAEIRTAYLAAARRAHPDVVGPRGEDTMRDLNSAWAVLGDPHARQEYDLTLPDAPGAPARASRSTVRRPEERPFVPYHAVDEDDDDEWRYTDDATDPDTAPGALLQLAPVGLIALGAVLVLVGAVVGIPPLAAFGAILAGLGAVAFLIVPLAVMARASTVEQRRERERDRRR